MALLTLLLALPSRTLEGKPLAPASFAKRPATVWVFVGAECPISNAYAPELNRLQKEFETKKVSLVLVYSDPSLKREGALRHWRSYHLRPPAVLDDQQELMKQAGVDKTPEAVVFDSKGQLVYRGRIDDRWTGLGVSRPKASRHDVQDVVRALLGGKHGPFPFQEAVGCYIPPR